ncbi:MAG: N-acetylmuramoyl-L-alanine amidase [candidate division Zixibacteria bacterium]|nr:N-acetylmuramoyl-L-alanine amidase [candidate division Zixibacteria bacterium]
MLWRNTFRTNWLLLSVTQVALVFSGAIAGTHGLPSPKAEIVVVYPKPDQRIGAVDSTFIFGHVPQQQRDWSYLLKINQRPVAVHTGGGFLAFLSISPGEFMFHLEAELIHRRYDDWRTRSKQVREREQIGYAERLTCTLTVQVPEPMRPLSTDSVRIVGEFNPPDGDLALTAGDRLEVSFRGTPGCRAWFSLSGFADSVPMIETPGRSQPYWGEAVFGKGTIPDSLKLRGIYSGFVVLPYSVEILSSHLEYNLAPPSIIDVAQRLFTHTSAPYQLDLFEYFDLARCDPDMAVSSYSVSLGEGAYPFVVRFTDSVQTVRHGPRRGYLSIFQPEGVEALVVGAEGDWYKVQLSRTQFGWVNKTSVRKLPRGVLPPRSYLSSIRSFGSDSALLIEFPLSGRHPYRVIEDDRRTLRVQLFGVTSDTDWIRYDFGDDLVDLATWSQPEEGLYELTLHLAHEMWGYDSRYEGNSLCLTINKPPARVRKLKGMTVVLDPGHSRDPGAIGPTGYTEAEANLEIALILRDRLQKRGARVVMTRDDDRHVDLYDRPAIAGACDADLFVSIHNNALPDGVNPFVNHGVSTYYYHPHSIDLARHIQEEMVKATRLGDFGLYHGNLAVNRPTQYPAVLVECAFMIIPEHEAMLKTDKFRKTVAKAICKGIEKFLEEYDRDR